MTVSAVFRAAAYAQETGEAIIYLLTISHPDLTDDIRLATDPYEFIPSQGVRGVVSRGLEFVYLPMDIILPSEDEAGAARAKITIDNIDRRIVQSIRSVRGNLNCKIEVVLSSDVDNVELTYANFELANASYDALAVDAELYVNNFEQEPWPAGRFTPSNFTGMF